MLAESNRERYRGGVVRRSMAFEHENWRLTEQPLSTSDGRDNSERPEWHRNAKGQLLRASQTIPLVIAGGVVERKEGNNGQQQDYCLP